MKKLNIKNLKSFTEKILKNKWLYYIFILFSCFIAYYNFLNNKILSNNIDGTKIINKYLIICTILVCVLAFVIKIYNASKLELYVKYIILSLVLGGCYLGFSPMFTQNDESFHFIRVYQIANGNLISPKNSITGEGEDKIPTSVFKTLYDDDDIYPEYKKYSDFKKESKIKLDKDDTKLSHIRCSNYIFLNYIGSVIGVKIGMILELSPYYLCLVGRITNLIVCTLIIAMGIKILPQFKKSMLFILLSPVVLAYIASLSADGIIIATSFLFISTILYHKNKKEILSKKSYIGLLLLIIFVSTCKVAYLPLIGLILLLPNQNFKNKKTNIISKIMLISLGIMCSIVSMKIGKISINTSPGEMSLFKSIIEFALTLINTIFYDGLSYIENIFAGYYMYQNQVNPFRILPIIYCFLFILLILSEKIFLKTNFYEKVFSNSIILLIFLLIEFALFGANTADGSLVINGVQGRYFIPILFVIPLLISKNKINIKNKNIIFEIGFIINIFVLLTMFNAFII